jgi:hypothetical protein
MALGRRKLIGEILEKLGFVSLTQVNEARREQMARPEVKLGMLLVEKGHLTREELEQALKRQESPFVSEDGNTQPKP